MYVFIIVKVKYFNIQYLSFSYVLIIYLKQYDEIYFSNLVSEILFHEIVV